jgi:hypothetical protein
VSSEWVYSKPPPLTWQHRSSPPLSQHHTLNMNPALFPNHVRLHAAEAKELFTESGLPFTLSNAILKRHCPLEDGHHPTSILGVGILSRLPVELQQRVLKELDMESLIAFRRMSKSAMNLVGSLTEWKEVSHKKGLMHKHAGLIPSQIMANASDALRMLIAHKYRYGQHDTIGNVFDALCLPAICSMCGDPSTFIDMVRLTRICSYHVWTFLPHEFNDYVEDQVRAVTIFRLDDYQGCAEVKPLERKVMGQM